MESRETIENTLPHFTGARQWFQHGLFPSRRYTEGVRYLAEAANCYWLIDNIMLRQIDKSIKQHPFQVWTLTVNTNGSAEITGTDGNDNQIALTKIPYTDFPLPGIQLFYTDNTLLLPSEY